MHESLRESFVDEVSLHAFRRWNRLRKTWTLEEVRWESEERENARDHPSREASDVVREKISATEQQNTFFSFFEATAFFFFSRSQAPTYPRKGNLGLGSLSDTRRFRTFRSSRLRVEGNERLASSRRGARRLFFTRHLEERIALELSEGKRNASIRATPFGSSRRDEGSAFLERTLEENEPGFVDARGRKRSSLRRKGKIEGSELLERERSESIPFRSFGTCSVPGFHAHR